MFHLRMTEIAQNMKKWLDWEKNVPQSNVGYFVVD